jgi:hypothetical protein
MTSFEELDQLSSAELHERATDLAKHRLDIRFFWKLFESIPEARAVAGEPGAVEADIQHASSWLLDFRNADGQLDDALRPVYIEYLLAHGPKSA